MATINLGGTPVTYGWGALIALLVLTVCVVLAILGRPLTPLEILGMIAALALSRLC